MTYRFVDRIPTLVEHQRLGELVGWRRAFRWEAMSASLLLDLVEGHDRGRVQVPTSTLRVRETTAVPAK